MRWIPSFQGIQETKFLKGSEAVQEQDSFQVSEETKILKSSGVIWEQGFTFPESDFHHLPIKLHLTLSHMLYSALECMGMYQIHKDHMYHNILILGLGQNLNQWLSVVFCWDSPYIQIGSADMELKAKNTCKRLLN